MVWMRRMVCVGGWLKMVGVGFVWLMYRGVFGGVGMFM